MRRMTLYVFGGLMAIACISCGHPVQESKLYVGKASDKQVEQKEVYDILGIKRNDVYYFRVKTEQGIFLVDKENYDSINIGDSVYVTIIKNNE